MTRNSKTKQLHLKIVLFLAMAIPAIVVLEACQKNRSGANGPSQRSKDVHLWAVYDKEQDNEIIGYLLGSVHFLREDSQIDSSFIDAFDRTKSLAVEVNLKELDYQTIEASNNKYGKFHDRRKLSQLLGEADYSRLEKLLIELKIPVAELDTMRPWLVSQMLVMLSGGRVSKDGSGEKGLTLGVDQFFIAKSTDRPIHSLESLEEQYQLFSNADDELFIEELRAMIEALELGIAPVDMVIDKYLQRDLREPITSMEQNAQESEEKRDFYYRLNEKRNLKMVESIDRLLSQDAYPLVVVGFLHMQGEKGLPSLLRQRGYDVRPVMPTQEPVSVTLPKSNYGHLPAEKVSGHSLSWPTTPEKKTIDVKGMPVDIWMALLPKLGVVMFVKVDQLATSIIDLNRFYDYIAEKNAQELQGKVASGKPIRVSDIPAHRFTIHSTQMTVTGIQVWADGVLYTVTINTPAGMFPDGLPESAEKILSSFSLDTYTAEEMQKNLERAKKEIESKPEWLFPYPECPIQIMKERKSLPHAMADLKSCQRDIGKCISKCREGDALACLTAGDSLFQYANLTEVAESLWVKACEHGLPNGCGSQAARLLEGDDHLEHGPCAYEVLSRSCEDGDPNSCFFYARLLLGERGVPRDMQRVQEMVEKGCKIEPENRSCKAGRAAIKRFQKSEKDN